MRLPKVSARSYGWLALCPLLLLIFLATGCSVFIDAPQSTFDVKGPMARMQLELFYVTLWVGIFIFVSVASALLYVVIRFRQKKGEEDHPAPAQAHGNPLIEISLIAVSVFLLVIIAVPTVRGIFYAANVPDDEDVLVIDVIAFQWWWAFEYPDGTVTANEFAIPVDRVVKFNLRTFDVIHSFWIPKLAGKVDNIPNRENYLWLLAEEEGVYFGQCAEFCGESHANMRFRALVKSEEDYEAWLAHQAADAVEPEPAEPEVVSGSELFVQKGCGGCHTVRGLEFATGVTGPDLTHFGSRLTVAGGILENNERNLTAWLTDPERIKPGNLMTDDVMAQNLTEQEISDLVAYLQSLK